MLTKAAERRTKEYLGEHQRGFLTFLSKQPDGRGTLSQFATTKAVTKYELKRRYMTIGARNMAKRGFLKYVDRVEWNAILYEITQAGRDLLTTLETRAAARAAEKEAKHVG